MLSYFNYFVILMKTNGNLAVWLIDTNQLFFSLTLQPYCLYFWFLDLFLVYSSSTYDLFSFA